MRFRKCGKLLLGNRFLLKLKVYRCCIRSAIPYRSEKSCLKENEKAVLKRTEKAVLRATVYARLTARALIFFNQTHYQALIQTGPYSSTGACYFQSKIMHKKHGSLFIFKFCSHGRIFKRALNQDRAVKRAYTVYGRKIWYPKTTSKQIGTLGLK